MSKEELSQSFFSQHRRLCFTIERPRLFFLIFASWQENQYLIFYFFFNSTHPIQRPFGGFPGEAHICAPALLRASSSPPCMQFSAHGMQVQSFFLSTPQQPAVSRHSSRQVLSGASPATARCEENKRFQIQRNKNAEESKLATAKREKAWLADAWSAWSVAQTTGSLW